MRAYVCVSHVRARVCVCPSFHSRILLLTRPPMRPFVLATICWCISHACVPTCSFFRPSILSPTYLLVWLTGAIITPSCHHELHRLLDQARLASLVSRTVTLTSGWSVDRFESLMARLERVLRARASANIKAGTAAAGTGTSAQARSALVGHVLDGVEKALLAS